jgi:hypothetical protein
MKKIFTLMCMGVFAVNAQQVYRTFESADAKYIYIGEANGKFDTTAANPGSNTVNASATCAKYIRDTATYDNFKFFPIGIYSDISAWATPGATLNFTMLMWTTAPVGTKIEAQFGTRWFNSYPDGIYSIHTATTKVSRAWEKLTFTFTQKPSGGFTKPEYIDKIVILCNPTSHVKDTFYLDEPNGPAVGPVGVKKNNVSSTVISQNVPNPAVDLTSVNISLASPAEVSLQVYDLLVKPVLNVMDNKLLDSGNHELNMNTSALPSGVYLYQVKAGSMVETRRMFVSER